jgi:ribosomal protein L16 Arg81 hydroxylase
MNWFKKELSKEEKFYNSPFERLSQSLTDGNINQIEYDRMKTLIDKKKAEMESLRNRVNDAIKKARLQNSEQ